MKSQHSTAQTLLYMKKTIGEEEEVFKQEATGCG